MGISTFMGVETALRGLLAQQRSLDVASHNIANANTVGYTRQTADLQATDPYDDDPSGQLGTGVDVITYQRARDGFLDVQLRAQTMLQGYYEARQNGLSQVELALNEPSDTGVSHLLERFWSSWQDVSNAPESQAVRQSLLQNAGALAGGLQGLRLQLTRIDAQTQTNIGLTIDDLNKTVGGIAALDQQIMSAVAANQPPSNDLLDRRDVLLDKLGGMVNLTQTDNVDGSVTLQIGSFTLLSSGSQTTVGTVSDLGANLTAGKLAGLVSIDTQISGSGGYVEQLDDVASALITAVNTAQASGYTLAGTTTSELFFNGSDASDIAVNGDLVADPTLVAASSAANQPGNGANALAIAGLRGSATIDGAYSALVTGIGSDSQDAMRSAANAKVLVEALQNRRDSISGVSIDEEMTSLIRFQRGYQASARALSAMDEMIDVLVNRTGRVGL
jgi:flagellar hook-associated protein 1 FlgK